MARKYYKKKRSPVYRRKKLKRAYRIGGPLRGTKMRRFFRPKISLGAFPNSKTVNLRYVSEFILNPGTATTAVYVFRANSIFDPDFTGIGHQPMFRDNYAALYNTYQVNHVNITFIACATHMQNTSIDNGTGGANQYYAANERAARMFIIRDTSATDYTTSLNTLIEEGNTNVVWRFAPQTSSAKMPILRMKCWPAALLKLSKRDDSLKADMATNPASQVFFICGVDSFPSGDSDSMPYQVILTYNVTFTDLIKNQTQN